MEDERKRMREKAAPGFGIHPNQSGDVYVQWKWREAFPPVDASVYTLSRERHDFHRETMGVGEYGQGRALGGESEDRLVTTPSGVADVNANWIRRAGNGVHLRTSRGRRRGRRNRGRPHITNARGGWG